MKSARFSVLTIFGFAVFALTMTFAPAMPDWAEAAALGGLLLITGALWLLAREGSALAPYRPVFFAYSAALAGLTLAHFAADPVMSALQLGTNTPKGVAVAKLTDAVLIVAGIIIVAKLAGQSFGSLYIRKGRLALGLVLGLLGAAVFVVLTFLPGGPFLVAASTYGGAAQLLALAPWVLMFVLANAFMEELLFRGLLLARIEALTGPWLALISTSLVFALAHMQVTYTADVPVFVALVFVLGLLWGLLMQKSKSIWGSVLFHAGADVAVILPIMQQMAAS